MKWKKWLYVSVMILIGLAGDRIYASADWTSFLNPINQGQPYVVKYQLVNNRNHATMAEATFLVDPAQDDVMISLDFYQRGADKQKQHYELDLLAYDHFSKVYVNQGQWLAALSRYGKIALANHQTLHYDGPIDTYSLVPKVDTMLKSDSLNLLMLLLPNLQKLNQASELNWTQTANQLYVQGSYTQLPEFIFEPNQFLNLSYQLQVNLNRAGQVTLLPQLHLKSTSQGLDFISDIYVTQDETLDLFEWWQRQDPNSKMQGHFELNSSQLIRKLTHLIMQYDMTTQIYQLDLTGVVEKFMLNLFANKTAGMKTYDFSVHYQLQLKPVELPREADLKISEWTDLAEQIRFE